VFRVFGESIPRLRTTIAGIIGALPRARDCPCGSALDGIDILIELP
jgi:5'-methylthioadenosine phosphorylase